MSEGGSAGSTEAEVASVIDRVGTHSAKWDKMEDIYGVSPEGGLAMWVADMDFRPPACVQEALQGMLDHGIYGYFGDESDYLAAIRWWMAERHGWAVEDDWITTTHGLVNGTALCVDAYTAPGDGVVLFTPVYHAFHRVIKSAGREVVECPLVLTDGRYEMDFAAYDAQMTGREKLVVLCSPHNPGGRVWSREELQQVAALSKQYGVTVVSDEIHGDLVFAPHAYVPYATISEEAAASSISLLAPTKTFNLPGDQSSLIVASGHVEATEVTISTKVGGVL